MKIHEYQAKQIFKQYGINVPNSVLCEKHEDIEKCVQSIGIPCVIKAQVYSGARGKSGGVKIAQNKENALKYASEILSMVLISPQAGMKKVNKILIENAVDIQKELYMSFTFDRTNEAVTFIISEQGGMDIEETAVK